MTGTVLVNNSFAVPGTAGCGPLGILDPIINQQKGLPSPAGTNTVVLKGSSGLARHRSSASTSGDGPQPAGGAVAARNRKQVFTARPEPGKQSSEVGLGGRCIAKVFIYSRATRGTAKSY